ncbi:hypothetical protein EAF04_002128 [Stromatinia cepivora]|nr:hypothetical protein EAF04_002128 [Stromatinia cepivora]
MPPKPTPSPCTHPHLLTTPHPSTPFSRVPPSRRAAATTPTGIHKIGITDTILHNFMSDIEFASTFPGPLVLDGDDLAIEPKQTGQTFRGWEKGKHRNLVGGEGTGARRIVYVMGPPGIDGEGVEGFMRGWDECEVEVEGGGKGKRGKIIKKGEKWETSNWTSDIISYLQAFYHGLPVKQMDPSLLHFTPWEETSSNLSKSRSSSRKKPPSYISLRTSTSKTGIRFRSTPSAPFSHQLNLSDLLDLAIDILPPDAYALLILVNHDLYEDDDDEFICGRAYGGSRVAVVSTARYNPVLDEVQGIERIHGWPGSHCAEYMNDICGVKKSKGGKRKRINDENFAVKESPLVHAITQQNTLPPLSFHLPKNTLQELYLSRLCRIASHELGHCFGIAHCVYYACCMQGSASIIEDARQPPYLCPVDLKKVVMATGTDVRGRYEALLRFCGEHEGAHMFLAFGAWIRARLGQMERLDGGGRE